jgi:N-acetylglucosaminyl-diphospho-decaprenol L-rhamnosyltransferase
MSTEFKTTLSIVSHGHASFILDMLHELTEPIRSSSYQIIITINTPEIGLEKLKRFVENSGLKVLFIENRSLHGFGKNHNAAFKHAEPGLWCVVNPDIKILYAQIQKLDSALAQNDVGLVFSKQVAPNGKKLDYRRELVTPWSLVKRYLMRQPESPTQTDWVSGCFMAFRSEVYQKLGGFDEKFFLYCEDVDICLRLQLAGYKMFEADFSIIHDTRRGTLKKFDHFKWHVVSLLKLWCSRAFWAYLWNRHKIRQR